MEVRTGGTQLRSVHFLRHAFSEADGGTDLTVGDLLVIGVGNAWRRDDGAGPAVADRLAGLPGLRVQVVSGEGTEVMEAWKTASRVVVVDAMRSGASPGTIRRIDATAEPLPAGAFPSMSHRFGLVEGVEMARILGRLPAELVLWGIEGSDFGQGPGLTPDVEAAVAKVAAIISTSVSIPPE